MVVLVVGVAGLLGVSVAARLPAVAPLRVGGQLLGPLSVRHTPAGNNIGSSLLNKLSLFLEIKTLGRSSDGHWQYKDVCRQAYLFKIS